MKPLVLPHLILSIFLASCSLISDKKPTNQAGSDAPVAIGPGEVVSPVENKPEGIDQRPEDVKTEQPTTVVVTPTTPTQTKVVETVETKLGETIKVQDVPQKNAGDYVVKFGQTQYAFILDASKIANCLLTKENFKSDIAKAPKFNYTSHASSVVAFKLFAKTPTVVRTYCKRYTRTLGYRNVGSNEFYVNICKRFSLSADLVNTMWHERSHVVGFEHWGNANNEFNRATVPYKTGDMSEKFYAECKKEVGL